MTGSGLLSAIGGSEKISPRARQMTSQLPNRNTCPREKLFTEPELQQQRPPAQLRRGKIARVKLELNPPKVYQVLLNL